MKVKNFVKSLYEIRIPASELISTFKETLKDKKIQKWIAGGIVIYSIPALYRYVTGSPDLPYIPTIESPNNYIPSNLPEKLIVNSVSPGGVGAVIGETFANKLMNEKMCGLKKYFSRVTGSLVTTSAWTCIQYLGHTICDYLKYEWPSGGNPFEPPHVYPFNLLIAITLAPLFPYMVDYLKLKIKERD